MNLATFKKRHVILSFTFN